MGVISPSMSRNEYLSSITPRVDFVCARLIGNDINVLSIFNATILVPTQGVTERGSEFLQVSKGSGCNDPFHHVELVKQKNIRREMWNITCVRR